MKIILLGPTGSGKGTQADFISKLLRLKHIEAGEILRKEAKKNKLIKKIMEQGRLIPDKHVIRIINNKTRNYNNFILDGFPRTLKQSKSLKFIPDLVLFLDVKKENIVKRLLLRKRFDDNKKNIETRYKIYLKQTIPVVKYFNHKKVLIKVNGNPKIKDVSKDIKKILIG